MAVKEISGFLKFKDSNGDTNLLLPITTKDNVDGMEEVDAHIANTKNPHKVTAEQLEAVRYTAQTLTDKQKTQARTNIGAGSMDDVLSVKRALLASQAGSITWDGVIGDRPLVFLEGDATNGGVCLVQITDEVPTVLADLPFAYVTISVCADGEYAGSFGEVLVLSQIDEGGAYTDEDGMIAIVPSDNYIMGSLTVPKKGVYVNALASPLNGDLVSVFYVSSFRVAMYSFADKLDCMETVTKATGLGDTLTWDGDTTGKVSVDVEGLMTFCLISDSVPTASDFAGKTILYTAKINGTDHLSTKAGDEIVSLFADDGGLILDIVGIAPTDNYTIDGVTFPKAGVYLSSVVQGTTVAFIASLTIPGYNFTTTEEVEVLKKEYLPEHKHSWNDLEDKPFGEVPGTDTVYWDGNREGLVKADGYNRYMVSTATPTLADFENGASNTKLLSGRESTSNLGMGTAIYEAGDGCIVVGNTIIALKDGATLGDEVYPKKGTYFTWIGNDSYTTRLTINGYTGFLVSKKLDAKWLPYHKHSWNDLEDKPFGDEWVEAMAETEIVGTVADGMYGAELTSHGVSLSGDEDQIIVIFDGAEYICDRFYPVQDSPIAFYGNGVYLGIDDTGEPFLMSAVGGEVGIVVEDGNTHTVAIKKMGVKKLDEKYLPEHLQFGEVEHGCDTLTWDGNTETAEHFDGQLYKVSDATVTEADLAQGLIVVTSAGITTTYTFADLVVFEAGIQIPTGECFFANGGGVVLANADSVYVSSITIPGYTGFVTSYTKKLDEKYLPEHKHSWNDLEDKPFGLGNPTVLIDNQTLTLNENGGYSGTEPELKEGHYYEVTLNGVKHEAFARFEHSFIKMVFVGNPGLLFGETGDEGDFCAMWLPDHSEFLVILPGATECVITLTEYPVIKLPKDYIEDKNVTRLKIFDNDPYLYVDMRETKISRAELQALVESDTVLCVVHPVGTYLLCYPSAIRFGDEEYASVVVLAGGSLYSPEFETYYTSEYTAS